jgi:stress-induced-phosphoprotein 1
VPNSPFVRNDANTVHSAKFTEAIAIEPTNHILYSNRSAAYASKKDYENALKDAEEVTKIKPDWAKGWGRKGAAMHGLGDLVGAHDAYEEGLKLDPNNAQNKSGLESVNRAIDAEAKAGMCFLSLRTAKWYTNRYFRRCEREPY